MTRAATGGEVATTYPVSTTITIYNVKAVKSQNPLPKSSTTVRGVDPLISARTATTTTPTNANTYASGDYFSVTRANTSAVQAKPFSDGTRMSSRVDITTSFVPENAESAVTLTRDFPHFWRIFRLNPMSK